MYEYAPKIFLKLVIKSADFKSHRHRESEMREMMEEIMDVTKQKDMSGFYK